MAEILTNDLDYYLERMRRARLTGGANPLRRGPLIAAPAWSASEALSSAGRIRTSNGGYYVSVNTGTTGSTAPAHVTGQAVSDGGVLWEYVGPVITDDIPEVPTVTETSSGSTPSGYRAVPLQTNTSSTISLRGCYGEAYATNGLKLYSFDKNATTAKISGSAEFIATGNFAVSIINGTAGFCAIVDGRYVQFDPHMPAPAGNYYTKFEWDLPKPRHVRLVFPNNTSEIVAIASEEAHIITAAPRTNKLNGVLIGDSYQDGSSYSPFVIGASFAEQLGYELGIDFWTMATGGTGVLNPGSGPYYTYKERITEALTVNPDIWFFFGSTNDIGYSASAIQSEVEDIISEIRAGGSTAPIIWCGPNPINTSSTLTIPELEDAISAAITASGDAGTFMLPANGTLPLTLGSWNNSEWSGFANNSIMIAGDGTHPAELGIREMVSRWALFYDEIVLADA